MTTSTTEQISSELLAKLVEQYRAELERLDYTSWTINTNLHSIRRLCELMVEHNVEPDGLTPDIAAELLGRAGSCGCRDKYALFIVRRFADYLASIASSLSGVASHDRLLFVQSLLPTSWRFLVRLTGAVSSSRPDTPRASARSRGQGWPQATARSCAARSVLDGGEHGATLDQDGSREAEDQPCVTHL